MHAKAHEILTEIPDISETGVIENAAEIPESIKSPAPESDAADADKASAFADVISRYNEGKEACDQIKDHVAGGKTAPTVPIYG